MPMGRSCTGTKMPASGSDTTVPPISMRPEEAVSSPATQRSVVVLPQPLWPSRAKQRPSGMAKETRSMTVTGPFPPGTVLTRLATFSTASASGPHQPAAGQRDHGNDQHEDESGERRRLGRIAVLEQFPQQHRQNHVVGAVQDQRQREL